MILFADRAFPLKSVLIFQTRIRRIERIFYFSDADDADDADYFFQTPMMQIINFADERINKEKISG